MSTPTGKSIVDFSSPAAGFDEPLALWSACHGRVQRMTQLLLRLAVHLRNHGADGEARLAAASVGRYFDQAAPHHHDDEEKDLFPRLRERAGRLGKERAIELAHALDTLEQDHRELGAVWQRLREPLARIAEGEAAELDARAVEVFYERYQGHMALEDTIVEATLRELLDAHDLAEIGRAMALRRGVTPDELG